MIESRDGTGQRLVACSTVRKQEQRYYPIIFFKHQTRNFVVQYKQNQLIPCEVTSVDLQSKSALRPKSVSAQRLRQIAWLHDPAQPFEPTRILLSIASKVFIQHAFEITFSTSKCSTL
jgi:hypothetical protein